MSNMKTNVVKRGYQKTKQFFKRIPMSVKLLGFAVLTGGIMSGCKEKTKTVVGPTEIVYDTVVVGSNQNFYRSHFTINDSTSMILSKGDTLTLPNGSKINFLAAGTSYNSNDAVSQVNIDGRTKTMHLNVNDTIQAGNLVLKLVGMEQKKPGDQRVALLQIFNRSTMDTVGFMSLNEGEIKRLVLNYVQKDGSRVHREIPVGARNLFDANMGGLDDGYVNNQFITSNDFAVIDPDYRAKLDVVMVDQTGFTAAQYEIAITPADTSVAPFVSTLSAQAGTASADVAMGSTTLKIEILASGRTKEGDVLVQVKITNSQTGDYYEGTLVRINGVANVLNTIYGKFSLNDVIFSKTEKKSGSN